MKIIFSAFLFLAILNVSIGQKAYFRVITVKGDVMHLTENGQSSIVPGTKLPIEGKLRIADGAMIKVITNDRSTKLQTPGEYSLEELHLSSNKKSMSFTGKFWKYLTDGLKNSDSKKELKAYGEKLVAGGIKGYSKSSDQINTTSPIFGKVYSRLLSFEWEDKTGVTFILKNESGEIVHSKKVKGPEFTLDMKKLNLGFGHYSWLVESSKKKSEMLHFEFVSAHHIDNKLVRIKDYVEGNEDEKLWIKAIVLEMDGYYYDSNKILETLVENDPNNLFYNKLIALNNVKVGNIDRGMDYID